MPLNAYPDKAEIMRLTSPASNLAPTFGRRLKSLQELA
jgi:hypothetical protein